MEFISKYRKYQIVLKPSRRVVIDGEASVKAGVRVRFDNFSYSTDDQEEIELLKSNKKFGVDYFEGPTEETKKKVEETVNKDADEESVVSEEYKCDNCDFCSTTKAGLAAHRRACLKQKEKQGQF